jgi:hypothetical protein
MQNRVIQYLMNVTNAMTKEALGNILAFVADQFSSVSITTAGLVISATTTKVKTGAADYYASVKGVLVKITAGTDMPVLVGTVTNARFNVFCFFVDSAGVTSVAMGTEGTTLAGLKFPDFPINKAPIGWVLINPTGTGNFVGGTTPLGDITVVPNAVYMSPVGAVDPTLLYA